MNGLDRSDGLHRLARHVDDVRRAYPGDQLLIVFDFDGIVVDQRRAVRNLLLDYDRTHGTDHFHGLEGVELGDTSAVGAAGDVDDRFEQLLAARNVGESVRRDVGRWWREYRDAGSLDGIDRARPGVMEVIRWFQLQPTTSIGFVSTRPAARRADVVRALNAMGADVGATFDDAPIEMGRADGRAPGDAIDAKVAAVRELGRSGRRLVAVVESQRTAIAAMASANIGAEILYVHATPQGAADDGPPDVAAADAFDLTTFVGEHDLPDDVALVWHGVNDADNLQHFLDSQVGWAECDVRHDPRRRLVLRHDSFDTTPWSRDEALLPVAAAVDAIVDGDRGLKLDLKGGLDVLPDVEATLADRRVDDEQLWFNADIDALGAEGFRAVREAFPGSIVQCPIDFLGPLAQADPTAARGVVDMLTSWGIDRFSVAWGTEYTTPLFNRLLSWNCAVNVYGVPDLDAFLRAVLRLPHSLTADFNFPEWNYFGRGSGERLDYHDFDAELPLAIAGSRA